MFSIKCFCKENISKIFRPLLAALSVNGLTYSLSCLYFCRELSATFSRLAHLVDVTKGDLESEVKQLKQEIGKLDATGSQAKVLK